MARSQALRWLSGFCPGLVRRDSEADEFGRFTIHGHPMGVTNLGEPLTIPFLKESEGARMYASRTASRDTCPDRAMLWTRAHTLSLTDSVFFFVGSGGNNAMNIIEQARADVFYIDTANASGSGAEDNKDMPEYVASLNHIIAKTRAAAVINHHTPVSNGQRERGHTSFRGMLDLSRVVTKGPTGEVVISFGKAHRFS